MQSCDVLIIGGGPAGLAAATSLYGAGVKNILLLEREKQLGGILRVYSRWIWTYALWRIAFRPGICMALH